MTASGGMIIGPCRECRHWIAGKLHDLGGCSAAVDLSPLWGECPPGTRLAVRDCEAYGAMLLTAHDFGCVLWEARATDGAQ